MTNNGGNRQLSPTCAGTGQLTLKALMFLHLSSNSHAGKSACTWCVQREGRGRKEGDELGSSADWKHGCPVPTLFFVLFFLFFLLFVSSTSPQSSQSILLQDLIPSLSSPPVLYFSSSLSSTLVISPAFFSLEPSTSLKPSSSKDHHRPPSPTLPLPYTSLHF